MKKLLGLLFALGLLSGPAVGQGNIVGPGQYVLCGSTAQMAVGPSSITQLVAAVAGQRVFICGWHVTNTGSTGTFSMSSGTGTNCGTNNTVMVPATNITSTAPSADHIDYASMQTGIGQAFCITPSVATISAIIYFNQF